MTEEQTFWNAAITHELRTPVTILRRHLQGLAEGVFTPDAAQFHSLLTQVEGLTRPIEDLRVISLAESGHRDLQVQQADLAADVRAVVEESHEARLLRAGMRCVRYLNPRMQQRRSKPASMRTSIWLAAAPAHSSCLQ
jgi:two-component system sensor histidine kinase AdeS